MAEPTPQAIRKNIDQLIEQRFNLRQALEENEVKGSQVSRAGTDLRNQLSGNAKLLKPLLEALDLEGKKQ